MGRKSVRNDLVTKQQQQRWFIVQVLTSTLSYSSLGTPMFYMRDAHVNELTFVSLLLI